MTDRTIARRRLLTLLALPVLARCGSGDPAYFTLAPWPGQPHRGGPSPIEVRTPSVASFLDRDYIVQSTQGYKLKLAGNDAWAEPISDMIARVLTSDLAQRLPDATIFKTATAIHPSPSAVVELVIDRFDEDPSGTAIVHASLAIRPADGAITATTPIRLSDQPASSSTADLVASLSHMIGQIADQAAQQLLATAVTG